MRPTEEEIKNLVPEHLKDHDVFICEVEPDKDNAFVSFGRRIGDYFIGFYKSKGVRKVLYAFIMLAAAADGFWGFVKIKNPEHEKIVVEKFESPEIWNLNLEMYQNRENRNQIVFLGTFGNPSPTDSFLPQARENMFYAISGSALPSSYSPYNSSGAS